MTPDLILGIVTTAYKLYADLRAQAKAAGVSDEELAAVTADYDARIAERKLDAREDGDGA